MSGRPRRIRDEVLVAEHPGRIVAAHVQEIPEDAPPAVQEGVARQRVTATTGQCPCGAVVDYGERLPGEVGVAEVWHKQGCPAAPDRLARAIRTWSR